MILLQYKLKSHLYYDDITIVYMMAVLLEYTFIFDYLLIQNNSWLQQIVVIFNFIVIQIQNIVGVNLFY